ncbi:ASE1 Anaphase spindle elongation protein [Candida maltosa Xu316]
MSSRETSIQFLNLRSTPTRQNTPQKSILEQLSLQEETSTEDDSERNNSQFDKIASNINDTISELNTIYQDIGYNSLETQNKKEEIFKVIEATITNFTDALTREKSNIENECEWLRQQIRIILSMINDSRGDKHLELISKGLVFDNRQQFEDGYKEQILHQITNMNTGDLTVEQHVLKSFVTIFKDFNSANLKYATVSEIIGNKNTGNVLSSLPNRVDAEYHKSVIQEFESAVRLIKIHDTANISKEKFNSFILASPIKNNQEQYQDQASDEFIKLRDVNYQLVRIIRGLRFTKITSELISSINEEIGNCENEVETRKSTVGNIIQKCLEFIDKLQLKNEQLLELQKNDQPDNEVFLELDTLNFILVNPEQFGLSDENIEFLINFQNLLQKTINLKQSQWDEYSKTCHSLWSKLNESEEYIKSFLDKNNSLSELSLLNFKMELNRLYIKRSEFIESFITDTRVEIEQYWDKMYYSTDMRSEFQYFNYSEDNDEDKESVLAKHEQMLELLKEEFKQKESIFQMYDDLKSLLKDQQFLIESSKDSSRLLSKNSCKILLNEEKIRKKINKHLPKTINDLKKAISQYNNDAIQQDKRTLFINGEDFFEKILNIESEQHKSSGNRNKPRSTSGSSSSSSSSSTSKPTTHRPLTTRSPHRPPMRKSPVKPLQKSPGKSMVRPLSKSRIVKDASPRRWNKERTFNNLTTIRLTNAMNTSLNTSIMSESSPLQANRSNSNFGKPPSVIQPLLSPLKPSNLSNTKQNTPERPEQSRDTDSYGKENSSPFDFSPIKIRPGFFENGETLKTRRISGVTNDTSTLIGDDYLHWRDEKIRQLNDM